MTHTYYEVIDTPISIEEVTKQSNSGVSVVRLLLLLALLENLRKAVVRFI